MIQSLMILLLTSLNVFALDVTTDRIFEADSQVSIENQEAVAKWLRESCSDLSWALSISERPSAHQSCASGLSEVHIEIELSHLKSEFVFRIDAQGEVVELFEEHPAWQICHYASDTASEVRSCGAN